MNTRTLKVGLVVLAGFVAGLTAQQPPAPTTDYVREHYTKFEYQVAERDGASCSRRSTCRRPATGLTRFS